MILRTKHLWSSQMVFSMLSVTPPHDVPREPAYLPSDQGPPNHISHPMTSSRNLKPQPPAPSLSRPSTVPNRSKRHVSAPWLCRGHRYGAPKGPKGPKRRDRPRLGLIIRELALSKCLLRGAMPVSLQGVGSDQKSQKGRLRAVFRHVVLVMLL